jgi:hypothetical protein
MKIDIARRFAKEGDPAGLPVEVTAEVHSGWGKTWLARLTAPRTADDFKFGVSREFLTRSSHRLSRAGNGTYTYTLTEPGIYEGSSVWRSFATWRVIFEVTEGGDVRMIASNNDCDLRAEYRKLFGAVAG